MRYLEKVGLGDAAHVRPSELSQGMQQRVGIARAFALAPRVLLLDEPFGMLDSLTRVELQEVLLHLWRAERTTALMVTHDVDEALFLADRVALMTNGPDARLGAVLHGAVRAAARAARGDGASGVLRAARGDHDVPRNARASAGARQPERRAPQVGADPGSQRHVFRQHTTRVESAPVRRHGRGLPTNDMDTLTRRIAAPFAVALALTTAAQAQSPSPRCASAGAARPPTRAKAAEPIKITPYGIAYFNLFSNTDAVNNGDVPLFAAASGPGHLGMTARQSRLGIRVTGAMLGKAKVTGVLEGDFFGGYPAVGIGDNMGVFRLRLANARLDWTKGSLVVGQDWMIFAPVNPLSISSAGIPLFAAAGNPWSRLPQVRGEWKTKKVLLQGGVLAPQTGDFNSAFFYQPGSGALSETPFLQGRAAVTLANFAASKKVATIGVSGHWGQSRVTTTPIDRTVDSNGIALDCVLPLGTKVTVQGEAFTGTQPRRLPGRHLPGPDRRRRDRRSGRRAGARRAARASTPRAAGSR